jgi:hypothetical protein
MLALLFLVYVLFVIITAALKMGVLLFVGTLIFCVVMVAYSVVTRPRNQPEVLYHWDDISDQAQQYDRYLFLANDQDNPRNPMRGRP